MRDFESAHAKTIIRTLMLLAGFKRRAKQGKAERARLVGPIKIQPVEIYCIAFLVGLLVGRSVGPAWRVSRTRFFVFSFSLKKEKREKRLFLYLLLGRKETKPLYFT